MDDNHNSNNRKRERESRHEQRRSSLGGTPGGKRTWLPCWVAEKNDCLIATLKINSGINRNKKASRKTPSCLNGQHGSVIQAQLLLREIDIISWVVLEIKEGEDIYTYYMAKIGRILGVSIVQPPTAAYLISFSSWLLSLFLSTKGRLEESIKVKHNKRGGMVYWLVWEEMGQNKWSIKCYTVCWTGCCCSIQSLRVFPFRLCFS